MECGQGTQANCEVNNSLNDLVVDYSNCVCGHPETKRLRYTMNRKRAIIYKAKCIIRLILYDPHNTDFIVLVSCTDYLTATGLSQY